MALYKVRAFDRFARKHGLTKAALVLAARRLLAGDATADLGGGLYKLRIAKAGGGRAGGFRALLTLRNNGHCFFVFGFEKSAKANIDAREMRALKLMARTLGSLDPGQVRAAVQAGELVEVEDEDSQEGNY